ncbi:MULTISPECIES: zinc-dependent alcohol dehydrogenase [Paenibacillus]|uniref:zinc-dependent alcohol dehydrogenase n=1 Tax=Paenibacillus TaxID=44249 RepID=UPI0005CF0292|nr:MULTISPECIES: alcohol dehydrogenase catalytic domain-containing protein [Paenibacillus]KAF6583003.1 alcohol dehydrogenase catalytic domain-containing protein [Paenibacillus sp. EKM211P]KJD38711.1 alcohol dehydrogenase [Paenibacillus polymyxa]MBE3650734.1 alcohol dehydrogenase catalytic domain-containing protein [Paenibacillus polymyxa]MBY7740354.1 alcohol dehydrogenase catalytic domain-containing protein [Paenibacillus polymyxa]MEE4580505.1 alcohol dehydrogenase catalytic domain-containing 
MVQSDVLLVHADKKPMPGILHPTPNQVYRNARVSIEKRNLSKLDPDKIRLEMYYVGICGTDLHLTTNDPHTGYIRCTAPLEIPDNGRIIGHEGVGRILEVGEHVRHLQVDMLVTLESIMVCNVCESCKKGKFNQCKQAKLIGLEHDGLFGTVVDVPCSIAHNITDRVRNEQDLMAAACIEPAGVAYVGCENAELKAGETVVIFGAGPIGVLSAMLSKQVFGASQVHVVEPLEFRRQFAKKWADHVYTPEEFFKAPPLKIDVVFESSAYVENVNHIFKHVSENGRIVLLGRRGVPLEINGVDHMITNEISVKGSRGHLCGAFAQILALQKAGRIHLEEIVTNVVEDLKDIKKFLEHRELLERENCKVVIDLRKQMVCKGGK